jgi:hypothetical protein
VTRDEIRRAIGSYATGSLTEGERKALYEAALEDQELFDELAGEHAFKQILEEPGAKTRLIAALSEPEPDGRSLPRARAWRWVTVAMVAASVVIAVLMGRARFLPKAPVEVARAISVAPQDAPEPAPPPPTPAAKPMVMAPKAREAKKRKEESPQTAGQLVIPSAAPAPSQVAAAGGVGGAASSRTAMSLRDALMRAPRFAFDYTIENGDTLMVKSAAAGYLRVIASSGTGAQVIFPATGDGRVPNGSISRLPIPAGTQELLIAFSAQPPSEALPGLSSTSLNPSGTVEDPNPSADSKLVLTLRLP